MHPFNWSAFLGVRLHFTLNLVLLQATAERGGPTPLSSSSLALLSKYTKWIRLASWFDQNSKGIFGELAILIIQWADPNHSVAMQLLHVTHRSHKAGKEGEKSQPPLPAAPWSWIGEVCSRHKLLPIAAEFLWHPKSLQFPFFLPTSVCCSFLSDFTLRRPYTPGWQKIHPTKKSPLSHPLSITSSAALVHTVK